MTHLYRLIIASLALLPVYSAVAQNDMTARPEWGAIFSQLNAKGTIVVVDERKGSKGTFLFNRKRAETRYSPASTFKIPHTLFALEAGVIRDEFQIIPWDGKKRAYKPWNQDQTLRSSMRHSVVWVYQTFEQAIGESRERKFMENVEYGNCDPTGVAPFWIKGNLRISAFEQINFLQRLYRNKLPFRLDTQRLVKDLMINEAGHDWILRAKTGWNGTIGWWVGWVEHPTGSVFFVLNIDTPNKADDLFKRETLSRLILESINALPPQSKKEPQK